MTELEITPSSPADAETILTFVKELAQYEKAEHEVVATVESIESSLFGAQTNAQALICRYQGKAIGFAVYFFNYSTWLGKNGLYLEDLYVSPEHRGLGAGKAILRYLANLAVRQDCGRFEWSVLDWNEPAIQFYESIGAKPQSEWITYRLAGDELINFAKG